jgi:hypothetical protein
MRYRKSAATAADPSRQPSLDSTEPYVKLPILAGALAILATGAAFAGEPVNTSTSANPSDTFKSLDTDGNGRISADEARKLDVLHAGYGAAVSDSNKGMSMDEFNAWAASHKSDSMAPMSPPSDPVVTPPGN